MFSTIFFHELKHWLKKPAFYIYMAIFFALSLFMAATTAGIFDSITATTGSSRIVNAPLGVSNLFNGLSILIFFLFPSIIGVSIYRDYKSEMHTILYSYPFSKANYLFAKFFSSILIVTCIVLTIGIGMFIGFRMPGTNSDIVGAFDITSYFNAYWLFILPNVLLFGAIVFAVVTFTRNIAAGFITVILLLFVQGVTESFLSDPEHRYMAALVDPYGSAAVQYYTRYWTVSEQNELHIPIKELILYNRLIWLGVASVIFALVYKFFTFSQNAMSFSLFKKVKGERSTKRNFGGITRINLPKVNFDYSVLQNLKTTWKISNIEFKYIVKNWPFISIVLVGLIIVLITLSDFSNPFGTPTYPRTWRMLMGGSAFTLAINICTFLYAGMLVNRSKIFRMNGLEDVSPIPNWSLFLSKFVAIVKMQILLLSIVMIAGILFQLFKGYYDIEIGLYIKELFGLRLVNYVIWAFLALMIQTLIRNPYLGLFVLIVLSIGIPLLSLAGVEQSIFKYNEGPGFRFNDMNGYGDSLLRYMLYKSYWVLAGLILMIIAGLFWVRGLPHSFNERLKIAKSRFKAPIAITLMVLLIGFLTLGFRIFHETNIENESFSSKEREEQAVDWEKTYKKYEKAVQPRIVSVKTEMNLFPKTRDFDASGTYVMVNKTDQVIDSIFLNHNNYPSTFEFDRANKLVVEDTLYNFDIYTLKRPMIPGDTMQLHFTIKNKPNTLLRRNSPIIANGTFISNMQLFPSLGYQGGELTDDKTREKYDLPPNALKPHPSDSTALANTYIRKDSDWIDFETTVSTSEDQIAIAPGYLQKEWTEDGRRYFHYKMDSKILNFFAYNSAAYKVKRDTWKDVNLEIYYHEGHEYNLERMMRGMKASLEYNSENFSPYQHKQLRIVEFPSGSFAQSFPNTIPFAGDAGFIADVDDSEEGGVDYTYAITVHEVAHQWWAHQVIGADVLGATMMSESLSEYVSLKVLEKEIGKTQMRKFLKKSLDDYLTRRTFESKREKPLMYNDGQGYIRYQKGSLIFYALSDYIGEDVLNNALKTYVEKVKFQEPPYTTSIDMVNHIKAVTPDSLQYVIKDMFETITVYDNRIVDVSATEMDNGQHKVDIEFNVSKYRNNEKGRRYYSEKGRDSISYMAEGKKRPLLSVKLEDYIDIGIFTEDDVDGKKKERLLYLEKHKITKINNIISIIVDEKPTEVGVDPFNKLIDTRSDDNRQKM
ncbi:ABC-2 type transport system permease protein [Formosa sp. Hel1_31_208]|uniref:ABC transporter permease/M1 family aminopeptidase n=1 Tax=Formosa sp. Hel1_31_208 TaxID=1798225 RepID=UPI00087DAC19|nr:M1 family aminopeptidase [Formosa sp. Hel1_31_208]SDS26460.1 ABC-2 type transport system permease protein [Formosa sp. Hel1_31_208]